MWVWHYRQPKATYIKLISCAAFSDVACRGSVIQSRKFHSYDIFTKGRMMTSVLHINMCIIAVVYLLSTFHLQVVTSVTDSSDNECKNFTFLERSLFESESNRLQLSLTFFPLQDNPLEFVKVTYVFGTDSEIAPPGVILECSNLSLHSSFWSYPVYITIFQQTLHITQEISLLHWDLNVLMEAYYQMESHEYNYWLKG